MLEHLTKILQENGAGVGLICDIEGNPIYEKMVWESETQPRPSLEEFEEAVCKAKAMMYKDSRRNSYPTVHEQLDTLFHLGYEGWKEQVQSIKDQFPKP